MTLEAEEENILDAVQHFKKTHEKVLCCSTIYTDGQLPCFVKFTYWGFLHRNFQKYYCLVYLLKRICTLKWTEGENKAAYWLVDERSLPKVIIEWRAISKPLHAENPYISASVWWKTPFHCAWGFASGWLPGHSALPGGSHCPAIQPMTLLDVGCLRHTGSAKARATWFS